jgi:hypothetical protein
MRQVTVAVGLIYHPDAGFFLRYNEHWGQLALPMKKPADGEDYGEAALRAVADDCPVPLPNATARPLEYVPAMGYSMRTGDKTIYAYHVFEVDPGVDLLNENLGAGARFLEYEQLVEQEQRGTVSWSTKDIAQAMLEFQEVTVAVISRPGDAGPEFLLVRKSPYGGLFFPAARNKTDANPLDVARRAVRWDTAYDGPIEPFRFQETSDFHFSTRYSNARVFRFYVTPVALPGVDLWNPRNPLAASLNTFSTALHRAGRLPADVNYWGWYGLPALTSGVDMSPTMQPLLGMLQRCTQTPGV